MVKPHNPVRAAALVCVAATSIYVMWMGYKLNEVLAGPNWCATAIGANRADKDSKIDVAGSCVNLLTIQLKSLATNSHILFGVVALCLLVLIVIVIAGGKLSFKASKEGAEADIGSRDDPPPAAAAQAVADSAQQTADVIKDASKP